MIKIIAGTPVEIIREVEPWISNGQSYRQVEVEGRHQRHKMLIKNLREDRKGEIEETIGRIKKEK